MDNTLKETKDRYIEAYQLFHQHKENHENLIKFSRYFKEDAYEDLHNKSLQSLALAERKYKQIECILVFANRLQERYERKGGYL